MTIETTNPGFIQAQTYVADPVTNVTPDNLHQEHHRGMMSFMLTQLISSPVTSVFGRLGDVIAVLNDYPASLINNDSGVAGATVAAALDTLGG